MGCHGKKWLRQLPWRSRWVAARPPSMARRRSRCSTKSAQHDLNRKGESQDRVATDAAEGEMHVDAALQIWLCCGATERSRSRTQTFQSASCDVETAFGLRFNCCVF